MKFINLKILAFLSIFLIFETCEKEEINPDELVLPEITITGEKTFGAIVNGKVWTANGSSNCFNCGPPNARVDYSPSPKTRSSIMYLGANNNYQDIIKESIGLVINLTDNLVVGDRIELNNSNIISRIGFFDELNRCNVSSNNTTKGYLELKRLDIDNGIVSGIFEADLIGDCDTINIRQGRFDLTFRTR